MSVLITGLTAVAPPHQSGSATLAVDGAVVATANPGAGQTMVVDIKPPIVLEATASIVLTARNAGAAVSIMGVVE